MAKRKTNPEGMKKSTAIRNALSSNPKASVKEIVASLDQQGIQVHRNHVYIIKSKEHQKTHREKRQRAVEATKQAGFANPVELILEVRKLADKTGGMRHLKALVDLLAE
jgi:hypothetical protein